MWIQLSTGRDSFLAQNDSPRRNVAVSTFTRVADDGEGAQIIPLFAAFQKKMRGFAKSNIVSVIPATDKFAHNDAGQWFVGRYEIAAGTEILIEYRHRAAKGGFKENIDYLMLIADPAAPLWHLRIDLPPHFLSNVPAVFFEGRFDLVKDDEQLDKRGLASWRKHLGADASLQVADYMDPSMEPEDRVFGYVELEKKIDQKAKVEIQETSDGKTRMKITRRRQIKVR